jgi:iron complex transport system ATP-binding protein
MLSADSISLKRGNKLLLDRISLTVKPGEVLSIVGPNGAGKSSLLKILCGEVTPDSGSVKMSNGCINHWTRAEMARVRAVLPQSSVLSFPFKVEEVVSMGRSPHRAYSSKQRDNQIVAKAMALVDIQHLSGRDTNSLSGGERQRVHLARVLSQIWDPITNQKNDQNNNQQRYLLLDEPTSALDMRHQHAVFDIARRFALEQNIAVLTIVHDLNLASQYSDQVVMLLNGQVQYYGPTVDGLQQDKICSVFDIDAKVLHPTELDFPIIITQPKRHSEFKIIAALDALV